MTYYADLTECRYFDRPAFSYVETDGRSVTVSAYQPSAGGKLVAVGWLDAALPSEPADPNALTTAVDALVRIWVAGVDPWPISMGRHGCGLCGKPPDRAPATEVIHKGHRVTLGSGYLTVPGPGFLYVAPSLIIHYILAHGYQPPSQFLTALDLCPDPRTAAYRSELRLGGLDLGNEHGDD